MLKMNSSCCHNHFNAFCIQFKVTVSLASALPNRDFHKREHTVKYTQNRAIKNANGLSGIVLATGLLNIWNNKVMFYIIFRNTL